MDSRLHPLDDPDSLNVTIKLTSLSGELNRKITLSAAHPLVEIGRASHDRGVVEAEDNLFVQSPIVSRSHASISLREDREDTLYLTDYGSTHGTYLNDRCVLAKRSYRLAVNDKIRFGTNIVSGRDKHLAKAFQVEYKWSRPTVNTSQTVASQVAQAAPKALRATQAPLSGQKRALNEYALLYVSDSDDAMEIIDPGFHRRKRDKENDVDMLDASESSMAIPAQREVEELQDAHLDHLPATSVEVADGNSRMHIDLSSPAPSAEDVAAMHRFAQEEAQEQADYDELIEVPPPPGASEDTAISLDEDEGQAPASHSLSPGAVAYVSSPSLSPSCGSFEEADQSVYSSDSSPDEHSVAANFEQARPLANKEPSTDSFRVTVHDGRAEPSTYTPRSKAQSLDAQHHRGGLEPSNLSESVPWPSQRGSAHEIGSPEFEVASPACLTDVIDDLYEVESSEDEYTDLFNDNVDGNSSQQFPGNGQDEQDSAARYSADVRPGAPDALSLGAETRHTRYESPLIVSANSEEEIDREPEPKQPRDNISHEPASNHESTNASIIRETQYPDLHADRLSKLAALLERERAAYDTRTAPSAESPLFRSQLREMLHVNKPSPLPEGIKFPGSFSGNTAGKPASIAGNSQITDTSPADVRRREDLNLATYPSGRGTLMIQPDRQSPSSLALGLNGEHTTATSSASGAPQIRQKTPPWRQQEELSSGLVTAGVSKDIQASGKRKLDAMLTSGNMVDEAVQADFGTEAQAEQTSTQDSPLQDAQRPDQAVESVEDSDAKSVEENAAVTASNTTEGHALTSNEAGAKNHPSVDLPPADSSTNQAEDTIEPARKKLKRALHRQKLDELMRSRPNHTSRISATRKPFRAFLSGCVAGATIVIGAAAALIATMPESLKEEAMCGFE